MFYVILNWWAGYMKQAVDSVGCWHIEWKTSTVTLETLNFVGFSGNLCIYLVHYSLMIICIMVGY